MILVPSKSGSLSLGRVDGCQAQGTNYRWTNDCRAMYRDPNFISRGCVICFFIGVRNAQVRIE